MTTYTIELVQEWTYWRAKIIGDVNGAKYMRTSFSALSREEALARAKWECDNPRTVEVIEYTPGECRTVA